MDYPFLSETMLVRFDLLESLEEEGWDGDCADPINKSLIPIAKKIVNDIVGRGYPDPFIGATPCGSIDVVWEKEDTFPREIVFLVVDDGEVTMTWFVVECRIKILQYTPSTLHDIVNEIEGIVGTVIPKA